MVDARRKFGNAAERLAARFLKKKGYKILEKQFRTRFGEIDLIAKDGDEIVFVEVKARKSSAFGHPEESVTQGKLQKIQTVAETYLQKKRLTSAPYRIDVVAVTSHGTDADIHHIVGVG